MAFTSVKCLGYQQLVYEYNYNTQYLNMLTAEMNKANAWGRNPMYYNDAVRYINRCSRQYRAFARRQKSIYREIMLRQGYHY